MTGRSGRPRLLKAQQAEVKAAVLASPHIEKDGPCAFTLEDIRRMIEERHGARHHINPVGRADASHGAVAAEVATEPSEEKRGRGGGLQTGAPESWGIAPTLACKRKRVSLWFQDEARIGQRGRVCHVWRKRGEQPAGPCGKRFTFDYIFAAAKIGSDDAFALAMPEANIGTMHEILDQFSMTLPKDEVAVMYADQAGCYGAKELRIPDNVILLALPAYSPEPNAVDDSLLVLDEGWPPVR
jgi:hypothetical protein